jgi:predicted RNase H-like nuclease
MPGVLPEAERPLCCIGLDLAWAPHNTSGAAVVVGGAAGGELIDTATLGSNAEIVDYVLHHAPHRPALVAVDAPLRVPNEHGQRPAEAELRRVFARYQAGAHPANRRLLARDGAVRGETLVAALAAHGFVEAAAIAANQPARQITEVYPHAAMIGLFDLPRTLKYKARHARARRLDAWHSYQRHLEALHDADPPLRGHAALLAQDVAALRGRALQHYEDRVDAVLCAYIALYAFRWGAARCGTFGTLAAGHIFTPLPAAYWPAQQDKAP